MSRAGIKFNDVNASRITQIVCDYYGVLPIDLTTKSRQRKYTIPRFISMHLISQKTKLTLMEIGKLFNRDHSSVIFGVNKVKDLIEFDKQLKQEVWEIKLRLS